VITLRLGGLKVDLRVFEESKEMLVEKGDGSWGEAMSVTPSMRGISQFPKPSMEIGMIIKMTMKTWAVTTTLHRFVSEVRAYNP
jgi:hypothetical protein